MGRSLEEIERIVGREGIKEVDGCFRKKPPELPIAHVMPAKVSEMVEVVKTASRLGIKVFTSYHSLFRTDVSYKDGILLTFSRFKGIERLEQDSLVAWVRRGSTFDEVSKELEKYGDLKVLFPLVSSSESVVENYVQKIPLRAGNRFPDLPFATLHLVLSDGRIMKTGEHALSEEMGDNRDDPGPNLSRWFFGSEDYLGLVYLSCIFLFPKGKRRCLVFRTSAEEVGEIYRNICRKELVQEALSGDGATLRKVTGIEFEEGFYTIFGFEGHEKLVDYQVKKVLSMMDRIPRVEKYEERMCSLLDEVWKVDGIISSGYLPLSKINEFYLYTKGECEIIFSSYSRGGCASFSAWRDGDWTCELILKLKKDYSFVEKWGMISETRSSYRNLLAKIKIMMDPKNLLNPTIYGERNVEP